MTGWICDVAQFATSLCEQSSEFDVGRSRRRKGTLLNAQVRPATRADLDINPSGSHIKDRKHKLGHFEQQPASKPRVDHTVRFNID